MFAAYDRKKFLLWAGGIGLVLFVTVALLVEAGDPPEILLFLGRFHPIVVHFPIGFLVLGGVLEVINRYVSGMNIPGSTVILVLALSAASAICAAAVGYFLSLSGGYAPDLISWHMWLGIAVAIGALGACALKIRAERSLEPRITAAYHFVLAGTIAALLMTGHLGGTLTHGSGYLTQYLPKPIKRITGLGTGLAGHRSITNVDSALVYTDLVQPILNDRCVSCHGAGKSKGDLRLDSPEQIVKGGEDGEVFVPGSPNQSEMVRRITLPLHHDDRMPPDGEQPLSVEETELIRWWVATGASFDTTVAAVRTDETPTSVQTVLTRLTGPREETRTGIYALEVPAPDSANVGELEKSGFSVQRISRSAPFLEVRLPPGGSPVDRERLGRLEPVSSQLAQLDLTGADITDGGMELIGTFEHLTRLHLQHSSVSDESLGHIGDLKYLEYLNLYGTSISDAGLERLGKLPALKTVYVWQTNVTEEGVERFERQRRGVQVNHGTSVLAADSTTADPDSVRAVPGDS